MAKQPYKLRVSLTGPAARYVEKRLAEGGFASADEVVDAVLTERSRRDELAEQKLAELRHAVDEGIEAADAGRVQPAAKVIRELRKKVAGRAGRAA